MAETNLKSEKKDELDLSKTEEILAKYEGAKGAIIPILQKIQLEYGYLPESAIDLVAERLNTSASELIGVSTFYAQFHLKPRGKHIVKVCCGTACHVKNSRGLTTKVHQKLKIHKNETTEDKMFTFEEVSCLGACGIAPVVVIDSSVHGEISPDEFEKLLDEYKNTNRE
ncbi:MAG: NADH-quinone oxidoreductase subunit NuoE [Planctomycetes bacterium]|nr:NADH-quinone oxidoreductase subunit NuoE [Planctomycetota bacterium]